jgi:hypothetical protein
MLTKLELGSSETLKQWPDKIFSPAVQPEFKKNLIFFIFLELTWCIKNIF